MYHRKHILCSAAIGLTVVVAAASRLAYSQPATISHEDTSFLRDAAEGGMDEVKLGELAQQSAANDRVKKLGQKMVEDHSKLGNQLQALAAKKNVTLPTDIGVKAKASNRLLSSKSGMTFDKSYVSSMVKDHENDIAAFEKEANSGSDEDVKAFAAKSLPTLREHLRMAQEIARQLGVSE
jgi:putative membrane protein